MSIVPRGYDNLRAEYRHHGVGQGSVVRLAGNFGFERGHYDVSVACAEVKMLPATRDRDPETLVVADGFSCRTPIRELADGCGLRHLAQVLAAAVRQRTALAPDLAFVGRGSG